MPLSITFSPDHRNVSQPSSPLASPMAIATRKSPLALVQARHVQDLLARHHGVDPADKDEAFPILGLVSTGDRIQDRTLIEAGGKGLFTKEIDEAQLDGRAAFAVHSMKDVPTQLPEGLMLGAILERADPRDMLLASGGETRLADLPEGAVLGTASLRRQAQALAARPDLKVVPLRGNVDTRLGKLREGEVYATFLARAGLKRLGRSEAESQPLEPGEMLPAVAQGAIGITACTQDGSAQDLLKPLNHSPTELSIAAERAFLARLDGSCRTPIAAYVHIESMDFTGEVLSPAGDIRWRKTMTFDMRDMTMSKAVEAGHALGEAVKQEAGPALQSALKLT
ncbi:hydroxymethylbilane synthase [Maricaulis sp.]|uniref:hydroxymethylbilane synthase n=1 Tax=Maricaulis sp. TaxID=1486257 RepID=UPI0026263933|nr:hydroxymethylbilane synthase [Maricaulis sp.]